MKKRWVEAICAAVLAAVIALWAVPSPAGEITLAAASDLVFVFKEIIPAFEKETGETVRLSLGSSGNFYAQIENGAPFDLFFSADIGYPKKLEEAGLVEAGSLYRYAVGRIVLWAPKNSPIRIEALGIKALLDRSVMKIAIANPKHAPYGKAAVEAMRHFQIYDSVKEKLVLGENVSQAAQFVASGSADLGVIALSLALGPAMKERGDYWEIPKAAYPPLEQGAVILKQGKNPAGAEAFLSFLRRAEGRRVMERYGFGVPPDGPLDR
jgi:molybdate transport system substrate-binding protein